jgi:hypothetical protein
VTTPLDLEAVRAYLKVPATLLSDVDLQRMMDAQAADWDAVCRPPATPGEVAATEQGWLRMVQREVAARNLPLGMVGLDAAEYGPRALPYLDSLVEQHQRPFRIQVVA